MNLQTHIREPLWHAISKPYLAENYNHAILDALHYLTEMLRNRSGLDSDGVALVGAALGGTSPLLRINKLQTQSDRDAQKGLEQILRGLFFGIRNPRAHEQIDDTKEAADALVYFVDYLVGILEESKESFILNDFLETVFDPNFYYSPRYAKLIVSEIPENRRLDTLIELYRHKAEHDQRNISLVCQAIYADLDDSQLSDFMAVVSTELRTVVSHDEIRLNLQVLVPSFWAHVAEAPKLRVEAKLKEYIEKGRAEIDINDELFLDRDAALGTWAVDYLEYFDSAIRSDLLLEISGILSGEDFEMQLYIFHYFLRTIPFLVGDDEWLKDMFLSEIVGAVNTDETSRLLSELQNASKNYPNDWSQSLKDDIPSFEVDDIPF